MTVVDGRSYASPEPVTPSECRTWREQLRDGATVDALRGPRTRDTIRYHARGECAHDHAQPPLVATPDGWRERLTCDDCGRVFQSAGGLAQHEGTCVASGVSVAWDE